jgi:FixJ family two-component response regulator
LPTFAAVILDVNLGSGTTGFDVARFARQVVPDLPVIYVSGDADRVSFETFGVPGSEFLEKPFAPEDMLRIIRAGLDCEGAA